MIRRKLLANAVAAPLLLAGLAASVRLAGASACMDLDAMPANQKSLRRSLGFKLQSPDSAKHCSGCAFFTANGGNCGKCQLLSGAAVTADSVCDSWTRKT